MSAGARHSQMAFAWPARPPWDGASSGSYLKLAYDAEPPATPIPVTVTLRNEGVAGAENVRLRLCRVIPSPTRALCSTRR
jgi:hypothetical protein